MAGVVAGKATSAGGFLTNWPLTLAVAISPNRTTPRLWATRVVDRTITGTPNCSERSKANTVISFISWALAGSSNSCRTGSANATGSHETGTRRFHRRSAVAEKVAQSREGRRQQVRRRQMKTSPELRASCFRSPKVTAQDRT